MRLFWAKPDQTYEEHIAAVYKAWKETIQNISPLIRRMGAQYGFSEKRFLQSSLLSVVLHDIGKLTEPFQRMMEFARRGDKFNFNENYRHELASFPFVIKGSVVLWKQSGPLIGRLPLEAMAVVAHHKRLNTDLISFDLERLKEKVIFHEYGLETAFTLAEDIFRQEGYSFPAIEIGLCKNNPYEKLAEFVAGDIFSKLIQKTDMEAARTTYALLKGILHYADWHGSGKEQVNYSLKTQPQALFEHIEQWCKTKAISFGGLRPFQQECATTIGSVIAVAPTGSGKTEASLLWALNNLQEMGGGKLIYLLPTMITANSIFRRLENYFGEGNVGLTHSTASFMFENEEDGESGEAIKDKRNFLFDKTFIRPATVATVDQLLTAGFNTGKWTLLETNAANAVIVIDEIHAYDAWTLGLIVETLKHYSKLGARFMLMSATLPESLIELFIVALPSAKIVKDQSLLDSCRNNYKVMDAFLEDSLDMVENAVTKGRKTLVVVNSVKSCQEIFRQLKQLNPLCYHSKFILKDRFAIEQKIEAADLVIATQVVEVSLDIDYDVMFTECAPPDAIAQRAGRINRRRTKIDSQIFIFKPSDISKKIYDPSAEKLLEKSLQAFTDAGSELTEADILAIVESVYGNRRLQNNSDYIDAAGQYTNTQRRLMGIFDNMMREDRAETTRKIEYLQIPVIPTIFKEEVMGLPLSKRRGYEVKMPYWYVRKHREEVGEVVFCDMNYDNEIGATFVSDDEVSSMII
ncbi:MAG: CRISPR-associated helicase Cas3' [Deltaproteobacteria bacterium]|nr:CRISPR-associated helicase Cas3' [Deltaproteobacteria bacterium]